MIRPGKKCICKKCEDCNFFLPWIETNDKGQERVNDKCGMLVLFEEIPKIRGSIDGLQGGVNEARNTVMKNIPKFIESIKVIATRALPGDS